MVGMAAPRSATTKKRTASGKTPAKTTKTAERGRQARTRARGDGSVVPIPVITPRVRVLRLHVPAPGMTYVEDAGRLVASYLPPPGRLAFYGGLGAAAVFGLIDWPVAAAIGLGTVVARRAVGRVESPLARPKAPSPSR
jgi:hypothetical protein